MRDTCLECVRKHIGEAIISMDESFQGYPEHACLAIGSLSHAAAEAIRKHPDLAAELRDIRLDYTKCHSRVLMGETIADVQKSLPDTDTLMQWIHDLIVEELNNPEEDVDGIRPVSRVLELENDTQ